MAVSTVQVYEALGENVTLSTSPNPSHTDRPTDFPSASPQPSLEPSDTQRMTTSPTYERTNATSDTPQPSQRGTMSPMYALTMAPSNQPMTRSASHSMMLFGFSANLTGTNNLQQAIWENLTSTFVFDYWNTMLLSPIAVVEVITRLVSGERLLDELPSQTPNIQDSIGTMTPSPGNGTNGNRTQVLPLELVYWQEIRFMLLRPDVFGSITNEVLFQRPFGSSSGEVYTVLLQNWTGDKEITILALTELQAETPIPTNATTLHPMGGPTAAPSSQPASIASATLSMILLTFPSNLTEPIDGTNMTLQAQWENATSAFVYEYWGSLAEFPISLQAVTTRLLSEERLDDLSLRTRFLEGEGTNESMIAANETIAEIRPLLLVYEQEVQYLLSGSNSHNISDADIFHLPFVTAAALYIDMLRDLTGDDGISIFAWPEVLDVDQPLPSTTPSFSATSEPTFLPTALQSTSQSSAAIVGDPATCHLFLLSIWLVSLLVW